ncbi:hypothetical protein [Brevibacterium sediminis]|uniref:hypothetical protein n=1 Tax=Brevibacterium sediminis TaxID=1857024 RepID=UPI003B3B573E
MTIESNHKRVLPAAASVAARFLNSPAGVGTIILAMAIGIFIIQPWGWCVAVVMMWLSGRWSVGTKLIVTAIVPAAFLIASLLPGINVGYAAFIIMPAPIVSAIVLWRRTV